MWGHDFENIGGGNVKDKEIADCLEPHIELTGLSLNGYRATNPPNWLNSEILPNLTAITITSCSSLERLPPFGQLPYLKSLILEGLRGLKKISLEFYRSSRIGNSFPALETLKIMHMIQLEEWREDPQSDKWFPCLKSLVIVDCRCLKKLPPIPTTSLKELELNSLEIVTLPRFKQQNKGSSINQGPRPLSSLLIIGCSKLTSLNSGFFMNPEQLASLEKLTIWNCAGLVQLPSEGFGELIALKSLRIEQCMRLLLLPMLPKNFFPPSVQQVILSSCGDLVTSLPPLLPNLSLISLLNLENCSNLISLPSANVMQCLKSLKELRIRDCVGLKSLGGLEAIPSLKFLMIQACPMLEAEPLTDSIEENPRTRLSMALDRLDIDHPELLSVLPLRNLHLTRSLDIRSVRSITALPGQWFQQNGASLHGLGLYGLTLSSVESLPDSLEILRSFRVLAMPNFYSLSKLPDLPRSMELREIHMSSEKLAEMRKVGGGDYSKGGLVDLFYEVLYESPITQMFSDK